jgi:carboxynorspermidine decarboxylase
MGDYSFDQPLAIGQRLMFDDMSHYTMVKTSTFNGIGLPSLALWNSETDEVTVVKQFSYQDFKQRLS